MHGSYGAKADIIIRILHECEKGIDLPVTRVIV